MNTEMFMKRDKYSSTRSLKLLLCFKLPCIQLSKIDVVCDLLYHENLFGAVAFATCPVWDQLN
jgi:hypothetical protein